MHKHLAKIARVVREISSRTDRHTHRRAPADEVISIEQSVAVTGRNTTGPLSHAAPAELRCICAVLKTTPDARRQRPLLICPHTIGGPVIRRRCSDREGTAHFRAFCFSYLTSALTRQMFYVQDSTDVTWRLWEWRCLTGTACIMLI